MKQLLLSTAISLVTLSHQTNASTFNAYILADDCSASNPASAGAQVCMSYLMGVFETILAFQAATEVGTKKTGNSNSTPPLVCASVAPTASDMQELFNVYAGHNHLTADMPAAIPAINAFMAAYPCK